MTISLQDVFSSDSEQVAVLRAAKSEVKSAKTRGGVIVFQLLAMTKDLAPVWTKCLAFGFGLITP